MLLIDRYIIRQFIAAFLFGLLAFTLIFILIDMMEKIDDFFDANTPTAVIAEYYLYFSPEIIKLMTPVAMLLAALFVMGRLTNLNELPAMKASGVSLYRILLPFIIVAFLVSAVSVYFNGWVVPGANQRKFAIERQHLQRVDSYNRFNIFFQDGRTRVISLGFYEPQSQSATRVSIIDFADTNLTVLSHRYDADRMTWTTLTDSITGTTSEGWVLDYGTKRLITGDRDSITYFSQFPIGKLSVTPDEIAKKQRKPDEMDYPELSEFIESQQRAGQDVARWEVEYNAKVAFPFASVVVTLFGVTFGSVRRRSGVAVEFGICVAMTFLYMGFMKTSQVFGYNGDFHPLLTAWLANLIFLGMGMVNLLRVQK
ncbi:MAG: LptF/LptG family permease [Ignavibacteriae bacterium]|nr:LptF/LptG family permease [Ignavibacteriota bacterium]